jgi:hypothetical protein
LNTKKKNVYPVHKPAAVDYIMLNLGEFLSSSNFVWRASDDYITKKTNIPEKTSINLPLISI